MKSLFLRLAFFICFLSIDFLALAQLKTKGYPEIDYFSPEEYRADTQNWAVLQDTSGMLLVGNNRGLLSYDGIRWELTASPNRSQIRSLAADEAGAVFWGALGDFGYLQSQKTGSFRLVSLKNYLPSATEPFEGVPNIFANENTVFFHTKKGAFHFSRKDSSFQVIRPESGFQLAYEANGKIWVNEDSLGLGNFKNKTWTPIPHGGQFAQREISQLFAFDPEHLLIFLKDEKPILFHPETGKTETWQTPIAEMLQNSKIYAGQVLKEGPFPYFMIGTLQTGLLIMDREGRIVQQLDESTGLPANVIWSMNTDRFGNIWLGLDDGIARIGIPSPFTFYPLPGLTLTTAIFEGKLYAGTTQGLFVKPWKEREDPLRGEKDFQPVSGTREQAWDLQIIGESLFLSHAKGLFEIKNNKLRKVKSGYVWAIRPWKSDPALAIAGTNQEGLWVLKNEGGSWQYSHSIKGFGEYARYLHISEDQVLWISHPYKGIFRLKLNEDLTEVTETKLFTKADGLPETDFNFVFAAKNQLLAGTRKGMFRYQPQGERFEEHPTLNGLLKTDTLVRRWSGDRAGHYWYMTDGRLGSVEQSDKGFQTYFPALSSFQEKIIYHIRASDGKNVFLGTPKGLYHLDPIKGITFRNTVSNSYRAKLINVRARSKEGTRPLSIHSEKPLALSYEEHHLEFLFGSDWLTNGEKHLKFRYRLLGSEEDAWSEWESKFSKEFTNLWEGDYTFELEVKNVHGLKGKTAQFAFTILPPVYRTWFAYIGYVLGSVSLIFGFNKWNTSRLEREKRHLESVVAQRTEEVVAQNEEIAQQKEEIEAQNESITQQNGELKSLNEEKNNLIGVLAHDMRNPLHQIKMMSQIMQMKKAEVTEEEKSDHLIIEHAADHLSQMITKILDLEALESGKVHLDLKKLAVHHVAPSVASTFEDRASAKQIILLKEYNEGAFFALLDQSYFQQVYENLISNAIKFSPSGKRVHLRLSATTSTVRLEVQDEGPGISEADQQKLFGKFQKLSAQPTGNEKSTGLGLSIVKKYVEAMQGNVWCESKEGKGANFIMEFQRI